MFQKTTLGNGLRVVTAPMPAAKSVAVMVMLAAGSRYETPPTNGIAHFAEHMFFKGTEKRPTAKDISAEVDGIGGEFNAFTSKEYTGYYIKCAAEHRSLALDVLADQLLNSKFDAEEVEREKGVIIEELNMYVDTPRDHVDSVYDQLLFGDQPLGWDIIGTKETIRAAGRQTFLDYLDAWYAPRRMVVGAAGAVDGEFAKLVREPVDEVELRRTKNYLKGRMVLQLEDPRGLLTFGLRREVLEDRLAEPEEVLEGVEAVTAADIQRLAGEVIRADGLN